MTDDEVTAECGCVFAVRLGYPVLRCSSHFAGDFARRADTARRRQESITGGYRAPGEQS